MTPGNKFQNILTLASIAISLCVRSIRTSSISYSSTHVTTALHSALLPHQCVKYIVTSSCVLWPTFDVNTVKLGNGQRYEIDTVMCWRSNRKSGSPSQKFGRRHISTFGLASSAPMTFFCLIPVYIVVFRPEWPPCCP